MKQKNTIDAEQQYSEQTKAEEDIFYLLESAAFDLNTFKKNIQTGSENNRLSLLDSAQIYISKAINLLSKDS